MVLFVIMIVKRVWQLHFELQTIHTLKRGPTQITPSCKLQPGSIVPLGKALYPRCLVPWKGLQAIGRLVAYL